MKTLRLHTLLLSVMLTALVCAQPTGFPTQWLMPKPQDVVETRTTFSLQRPVLLNDPTSSALLASLFETAAEAEATVTVKLVDDAALGTFDYVLHRGFAQADEPVLSPEVPLSDHRMVWLRLR